MFPLYDKPLVGEGTWYCHLQGHRRLPLRTRMIHFPKTAVHMRALSGARESACTPHARQHALPSHEHFHGWFLWPNPAPTLTRP